MYRKNLTSAAVKVAILVLLSNFFGALTVHAAADPAGSNVSSDGTVYFINAAGQKQPYTSAGAFLSYGFNSWANVVPATPDDLNLPTGPFVPPMDGSLINDKGTVYVITDGQRAAFTSASVFTALGYSFASVIPGDTSFLTSMPPISSAQQAHVPGTIILDHITSPPTAYLVTSAGKDGIPSPSVFSSWGYSWAGAVPADSFDWALPQVGVMPQRVPGYLSPLSQPAQAAATATATAAPSFVQQTQPIAISELTVTGITSTSATINWQTDNLAQSTVSYGTDATYSATPVSSTQLVLAHTIELVALAPDTTYHYQVSSQTSGGATATSADATFTTLQGQAAVVVAPTSLVFGPIQTATTSPLQTIIITNDGAVPLNIVSAVSPSLQFTVSGLSATGLTPLGIGQSVVLSVSFTPAGLNTATATLLVTFDAAPAMTVSLTGSSYPAPQINN